jgi:hypothetical protein
MVIFNSYVSLPFDTSWTSTIPIIPVDKGTRATRLSSNLWGISPFTQGGLVHACPVFQNIWTNDWLPVAEISPKLKSIPLHPVPTKSPVIANWELAPQLQFLMINHDKSWDKSHFLLLQSYGRSHFFLAKRSPLEINPNRPNRSDFDRPNRFFVVRIGRNWALDTKR